MRGHGVMAGYYKAPEATARVIDADGWLSTGDLARRRDDGNYRIVGRRKELIIRGGENIYPPEVEEFLLGHPAVAEVAVVGLPDPKYGEVVSAWVVPRPGATITRRGPPRPTAGARSPTSRSPTTSRSSTQLPRTVTGKVRKHMIRDQGIALYGLETIKDVPTA